jgi:Bacterial TSP3 repeat
MADRLLRGLRMKYLDSDGDGLSNVDEARLGTDPGTRDTDGDGITDGDEVALGLDPLRPFPQNDDGDLFGWMFGDDPGRDAHEQAVALTRPPVGGFGATVGLSTSAIDSGVRVAPIADASIAPTPLPPEGDGAPGPEEAVDPEGGYTAESAAVAEEPVDQEPALIEPPTFVGDEPVLAAGDPVAEAEPDMALADDVVEI